jgi:hydrogenase expression/formation protein HypC
MCLSIPGEVLSIENEMARVSIGGAILNIGMQLLDDVKPGDFVLVHSGFAIQKLNREEAGEINDLLKEISEKQ